MKRSMLLAAVVALTLATGSAFAAKKVPVEETSCTIPAYTVVDGVTDAQASIIMSGHYCSGQTAAELTVILFGAGLAEAVIQSQIDAVE